MRHWRSHFRRGSGAAQAGVAENCRRSPLLHLESKQTLADLLREIPNILAQRKTITSWSDWTWRNTPDGWKRGKSTRSNGTCHPLGGQGGRVQILKISLHQDPLSPSHVARVGPRKEWSGSSRPPQEMAHGAPKGRRTSHTIKCTGPHCRLAGLGRTTSTLLGVVIWRTKRFAQWPAVATCLLEVYDW